MCVVGGREEGGERGCCRVTHVHAAAWWTNKTKRYGMRLFSVCSWIGGVPAGAGKGGRETCTAQGRYGAAPSWVRPQRQVRFNLRPQSFSPSYQEKAVAVAVAVTVMAWTRKSRPQDSAAITSERGAGVMVSVNYSINQAIKSS